MMVGSVGRPTPGISVVTPKQTQTVKKNLGSQTPSVETPTSVKKKTVNLPSLEKEQEHTQSLLEKTPGKVLQERSTLLSEHLGGLSLDEGLLSPPPEMPDIKKKVVSPGLETAFSKAKKTLKNCQSLVPGIKLSNFSEPLNQLTGILKKPGLSNSIKSQALDLSIQILKKVPDNESIRKQLFQAEFAQLRLNSKSSPADFNTLIEKNKPMLEKQTYFLHHNASMIQSQVSTLRQGLAASSPELALKLDTIRTLEDKLVLKELDFASKLGKQDTDTLQSVLRVNRALITEKLDALLSDGAASQELKDFVGLKKDAMVLKEQSTRLNNLMKAPKNEQSIKFLSSEAFQFVSPQLSQIESMPGKSMDSIAYGMVKDSHLVHETRDIEKRVEKTKVMDAKSFVMEQFQDVKSPAEAKTLAQKIMRESGSQSDVAWMVSLMKPEALEAEVKSAVKSMSNISLFKRKSYTKAIVEGLKSALPVQFDEASPKKTMTFEGKTYNMGSTLGKGGFGLVMEYVNESDSQDRLAVKVQDISKFEVEMDDPHQMVVNELLAHRHAQSEDKSNHVVPLLGAVRQGDKFITVMQVAKGGDLEKVHTKLDAFKQEGLLSEETQMSLKKLLLKNVIDVMKYIQTDRNMMHLDIKEENFMIDETGKPLLADFGLSEMDHEVRTDKKGTDAYMAPEVARSSEYNQKSDTFSLGVIFERLMVKEGKNSPSIDKLVTMMKHPEPDKRPTLNAVSQMSFFQDSKANDTEVSELMQLLLEKPRPDIKASIPSEPKKPIPPEIPKLIEKPVKPELTELVEPAESASEQVWDEFFVKQGDNEALEYQYKKQLEKYEQYLSDVEQYQKDMQAHPSKLESYNQEYAQYLEGRQDYDQEMAVFTAGPLKEWETKVARLNTSISET